MHGADRRRVGKGVMVGRSVPPDHVLYDDPLWADTTGEPRNGGGWRILWFAVLLVLAVAAVALFVTSRGGTATSGSYIATPGVLLTVAPDQRVAGPRLQGRLLDGSAFDSAAWAGQVVVVNVWGSWCPPCRAETPELVRVANATRAEGVRFLGVDIRDGRASARAFVREYQVPYPSLFDPEGRLLLSFRGVPPNAVPTTFVLDRRGRIAARALGRVTAAQLFAVLRTVNQEAP